MPVPVCIAREHDQLEPLIIEFLKKFICLREVKPISNERVCDLEVSVCFKNYESSIAISSDKRKE